MSRKLKLQIIGTKEFNKSEVEDILRQYNIKKLSCEQVQATIKNSMDEASLLLNESDLRYAIKCFNSGVYYDQEKKRWNSQSPLRKREIQKVIEFINVVIFLAPPFRFLEGTLPGLKFIHHYLGEKKERRKMPSLDLKLAHQKMRRHVIACLCDLLVNNVKSPPETRKKQNPALGPAASAAHDILKLYRIDVDIKTIKGAYHDMKTRINMRNADLKTG